MSSSNGLPTAFCDNSDLLKKSLLQFPRRYQHEFGKAAKVDLRRVLCFAASHTGEYMKHLFHDVDESVLPKAWQHVLIPERFQHLEKEDIYFQRSDMSDPSHPNRSCGRKFRRGEPIHRCITCGKDEGCGLCSNCFDEAAHHGHDVVTTICSREVGGVCDCGDIEGWNYDCHCEHLEIEEVPESEIPEKLKDSLLQTFEVLLDYIIDVMAGCTTNLVKNTKQDNQSILSDSFKSNLDAEKYFGTDWASDKFYLLLYNDQNKQFRDAVQRICAATDKVEDFSYMVADEVNLNGRAKVIGSTHIDQLLEAQKTLESTGFPTTIRSARDIFREEMCSEILKWIIEMCHGSIYGNYNIARNLLTKAFCKKWNMGVSALPESTYPGSLTYNMIPLSLVPSSVDSTNHPEHWDSALDGWRIDSDLAEEIEYDTDYITSKTGNLLHGSRLQYFLYFDIRFWKGFRFLLHSLFNCIITSNTIYRSIVCAQYVDIHPLLLELFFSYDREPENSVMTSLNAQIFASSSNATMIADHGMLTKFLSAAYGFLTQLHVLAPEQINTSVPLDTGSFKSRKISQVFYDVCCVLMKTENFDKVLTTDFVNQICDILELFQGKPTMRREAVEHVEYESNDYGLYFNMYSMTSSLTEMFSRIFLKVDHDVAKPLIRVILDRLIYPVDAFGNPNSNEGTDRAPFVFIDVDTAEGPQRVVDFKVHTEKMSFVHPVHAFFALAVQYSRITDIQCLLEDTAESGLLNYSVIEYPLRVQVMLSQIRTGFWVRNGFVMKSQLHIYESSGIRESGYKRDLSLIQFMTTLFSADSALATIFSRWALLPWLKEDFGNHNDYDESTLQLMVEECLLFLIHVLTDTSFVSDTENVTEATCEKALIHVLCFGPLSYSKLCNEIPDFLSHEKKFDIYLKRIADYIPPTYGKSAGVYKLKPEFFAEVDPYYIHYTANKRDDTTKLLRDKEMLRRGVNYSETFLPPKTPNLDGTILKDLYRITASKNFVQFLRSCLKYVDNEGVSKAEVMLTQVLHLVHLAIDGKNLGYSTKFAENIWSELRADHNEPFYYESVGSILYKFLTIDLFAAHHAKIRAIFHSLLERNGTVDGYLKEQVVNFDPSIIGVGFLNMNSMLETELEKKKRIAKERSAKIMARFKKRQNKFVEENQVEADLEDIEMEVDEDEESLWKYPEEHCILCQMPADDQIFGVACHVGKSTTTRNISFQDKYWTLRCFEDSKGMDSPESLTSDTYLETYFTEVRNEAVIGPSFANAEGNNVNSHVTANACGHGMHYSCFKEYIASSQNSQLQITRSVPEDFEDAEFTCPLCKSLANSFIPILWSSNRNQLSKFVESSENWFDGFKALSENSCCDPSIVRSVTQDLVNDSNSQLLPKYRDIIFNVDHPNELNEIIDRIDDTVNSKLTFQQGLSITALISNTIKSFEISLRGVEADSGLITNALSNQMTNSLRVLLEFRKTWIAVLAHQEIHHQEHTDSFPLDFVEMNLGKLQYFSSDKVFETIVEIDIFDFIVSCVGVEGISTYSIYRLGYVYFIIQTLSNILVQLKENLFEGEYNLFDITTVNTDAETLEFIVSLARNLRDNHPIFDNLPDDIFESPNFPSVLFTLLLRSVTPFLRRIAIWSFGECSIESSTLPTRFDRNDGLEADRLCHYLNLPVIAETLKFLKTEDRTEKSIFDSFVHYIQTTDNELDFADIEYPGAIKLVDLPDRLDDVFTKFIYKKDEFKNLVNFDPAICLFCGDVVHLQKKWGTGKIGQCNHHTAEECISEVGIFLLPRHNSFLLLHRGNGSFHPIPYINSHGDYEADSRQSQLLYLNQIKYEQFMRYQWLEHNIPNYITRKLEGIADIGGWITL